MNDSAVTVAGAVNRSTRIPCWARIGRIAAAVFASNAYANGSVLVTVGAKLTIIGIFTSLMTPVRWRLPIPASRFVESVSGVIISTRTSSMRVVSMRERSASWGDVAGFFAHAATLASACLPRSMISRLCSATYDRISLTKS